MGAEAREGQTRPGGVRRGGRVGDVVALTLIVGGTALFFYARRNLEHLAASRIVRVEGQSAIDQAVHFVRLSKGGLWVAAAGLALAVLLALRQRRRPFPMHAEP